MIQYPLHGSYSPSQLVMVGSFDLVSSGNPTVLRDGTKVASAKKMFTVTRVSAGLYEVAFNAGFPIPARPFILATIEQAADPTEEAQVHVVKSSYSQSARTFRLQVKNSTTAAASDGDSGDRVNFMLIGAIDSVGTDPA
jgi:hypothetical protein